MKLRIKIDRIDRLYRMTRDDYIRLYENELLKAGFDLEENMSFTLQTREPVLNSDILIIEQEDRFKKRSPFETIPSAII